ncbi:MAG: DNA-processing protein DprA, partial [Phycisphaerales bacterium]|nr:DNA-processing protein DprA [Phycisphaerales bacterium]
MPPAPSPQTLDLLALTLIPGLGPVLIGRAIAHLGGPDQVLAASPAALQTVPGIGPEKARAFFDARTKARDAALRTAERAAQLAASVVGLHDPQYPPHLRTISDPPPVLFVRGTIDPTDGDRYPLDIVGSRECTQYGREQTARFAGTLASAGITIVSGGARGIDTAAHTAAIRSNGRTIVALGCGIANAYPPENQPLFDQIVAEGRGAIISELPIDTPPSAENFPARNRIISGLSLGVLLVEAAAGSGSLITARLAAEDHGREVFALPGRVDSPASQGANDLIKSGGAHLVTTPADVLNLLEQPARHTFNGTHSTRYARPGADALFGAATRPASLNLATLTDAQHAIYDALESPLSADDLLKATGLPPASLRAELTLLELRRLVTRTGGSFARSSS